MAGYIANAYKLKKLLSDIPIDDPDCNELRERTKEDFYIEWKSVCQIAARLEAMHLEAREAEGLTSRKHSENNNEEFTKKDFWYFITIRPNKQTFEKFKMKFEGSFVNRKIIKDIKWVYEQKGCSEETLGIGFHVHAILKTYINSPKNLEREMFGTFGSFCGRAGVNAKKSFNHEEMFKNYCGNHVSEDGHKAVTKEWDRIWRSRNGLKDFYELGQRLNQGVGVGTEEVSVGPEHDDNHSIASFKGPELVTFD